MTWSRRVVVVAAMTLAAVMGLSSAAWADVIGEGPGVRARGDWTWGSSPYNLLDIQLGVRDTACDGRGASVHLRLYYDNGGTHDTQRRENHAGCGNAVNWDTYWSGSGYIVGVRVIGCVIGGDCYASPYHARP
ncbi:hypothetical protein [Micromonospora echinospora]|uniref:hypothetical protein n=1 Tax=Micromonospora echinospora TaxID=1877 RepID=UPI00366C1C92